MVAVVMAAILLLLFSQPGGLRAAGAGASGAEGAYKVATPSLPVYKEPIGNAAVIGHLERGTIVQASHEQNGWLKISGGGVSWLGCPALPCPVFVRGFFQVVWRHGP